MRRLLAPLALVAALAAGLPATATSAGAPLPVNDRVREMTLAYCLTGDEAAAAEVLAKRLLVTGRFGISDAGAVAAAWVGAGYCAAYIAAAEAALPGAAIEAAGALHADGFTVHEPLSRQAGAKEAGYFGALDGAFAAVGRALDRAYRHAGAGVVLCTGTAAARLCDESWAVRVNAAGEGFAPSPGIGA